MTLSLTSMAAALGGEVVGNTVNAPGPGHSAEDRSLSVTPDASAPDRFLVHSFAGDDDVICKDYVRKKLGMPAFEPKKPNGGTTAPWTILREHIYQTKENAPHTRVRKLRRPNGEETYAQAHWDGRQWVKGKPKGAKQPYRLPQLAAAALSIPIYFCEGEKDCDNLAKLGFVATTASEGSSAPWDKALTPHFKDRNVIILADADKVGRAHGQKVAKALDSTAASVKVLDLYPDRQDGSDVSNWLEDDTAGAKLVALAKKVPLWELSADSSSSDSNTSDDALIAELAALSPVQYEKRREAAAKQVDVRMSVLDKLVEAARAKDEEAEEDPTVEPLYSHWSVEAAEEQVDGDVLMRAIVETLKRYVIMTDDQALVVALWVVFTWLHETVAVHSPILLAKSPLPNSGKTTLLKLVTFLVRNGLSSVSITGPALFRSIENWSPTIAIDEADTAFLNNFDLKDVVNSGWTRGDCIIRCDPDTHEPRPYSTFCPKALGMIGRRLPDATLSRCLIIAMRRKRAEEQTADFEHIDNENLARLRRQLLRWTNDNAEAVTKADPEIPPGLYNRTRMNWRALLAIAELCGRKTDAWKAVTAIEAVHAAADPELQVQLLADIRAALVRVEPDDQITTKKLLEELAADTDGPWAAYGKGGKKRKPITARQLALLLKDFNQGKGIKSRDIRTDGAKTALKGYPRADFEDDFKNYLPPFEEKPTSRSATSATLFNFKDLGQKSSATDDPDVTDENSPNPLETNDVADVADRNPESEEERDSRVVGLPPGAELVGRAGAGERCHLCGKASGVFLVRRYAGDAAHQVHPSCAGDAWSCEAVDETEVRSCRQCEGAPDGTEQLHDIAGKTVWLHPQCRRFYVEERQP
jgi:5S rRNA maturation endonuclease (ribonuclease M5)